MNRSQSLVLAAFLALVPSTLLLAGCPEEKKADTTITATTQSTEAAIPSATTALTVAAEAAAPPAADAGSGTAADAGKHAADAGKTAPKK